MMREGPQLRVAKAARAPPCTLPLLGRRLSHIKQFISCKNCLFRVEKRILFETRRV